MLHAGNFCIYNPLNILVYSTSL